MWDRVGAIYALAIWLFVCFSAPLLFLLYLFPATWKFTGLLLAKAFTSGKTPEKTTTENVREGVSEATKRRLEAHANGEDLPEEVRFFVEAHAVAAFHRLRQDDAASSPVARIDRLSNECRRINDRKLELYNFVRNGASLEELRTKIKHLEDDDATRLKKARAVAKRKATIAAKKAATLEAQRLEEEKRKEEEAKRQEAEYKASQEFAAKCDLSESGAERHMLALLVDRYKLKPVEPGFFQGEIKLRQQVQVLGGRYRLDFLLGDRLVVEVDGRDHHASPEQIRRDAERDEAIRKSTGYAVLRIAAARLYHAPDAALGDIDQFFDRLTGTFYDTLQPYESENKISSLPEGRELM